MHLSGIHELKVLVTGGSGFIGTWTIRKLLENNHEAAALDVRDPLDDIEFHKVDVRNFKEYERVAKDFDAVIHLAAIVGVEDAYKDPITAEEVNVRGTLNVLEVARERGQKVVYASSASVYGEPKYVPMDEDHPLRPKSVYGATKLGGEALVVAYAQNYQMKTVALRYFNVYGPLMKRSSYAGVIYHFLVSVLKNEPLPIYGDGTQVRDYVYVEDVARANVMMLSRGEGVYNVGTGKGTSVNDLAELVFEVTGKRTGIRRLPPRPGDPQRSVADIRRITELGWKPLVSLEEGIRRTWEWLREEVNQ